MIKEGCNVQLQWICNLGLLFFQENFIDIYNEIDDGIVIWFSNFYF